MIQWDEERGVLTDYMGMPLSRSDVLQLRHQIKRHLRKSAADLAAVAMEVARDKYPNMVDQISFAPGKYE